MSVKRKLSVVLAADAVNYSRLMARDEDGTLETLEQHRGVIDNLIAAHDGRIFHTAGDSVVADFLSAVEAVRCAVQIQDALKTRNEALPEEKRLLFRIGVNLGDVVVHGDDLLGDGVNVAARIEGLAEPGGILISGSVYENIAGKLMFNFADLGERTLKNIPRPVRVFRFAGTGAPIGQANSRRRPRPLLRSLAAGVLVAACLGAGAAWFAGIVPGREEVPGEPTAAGPKPIHGETVLWQSVQSSLIPAELEAYLAHFPDGLYSAVARARLDALKAAEAKRIAEEREAAELTRRVEMEAAAIKQQAQADLEAAETAQREAAAAAARAKAEEDELRRRMEEQRQAAERERKDYAAAAARAKAEAARLAAKSARAHRAGEDRVGDGQMAAGPTPLPPAAPKTLRLEGDGTADLTCQPHGALMGFSRLLPMIASGGGVTVEGGTRGQPGHLSLRGQVTEDGRVRLEGSGLVGSNGAPGSYGRSFQARLSGTCAVGRCELSGVLGQRPCSMLLRRGP